MHRATIDSMPSESYSETITVPAAVRFPVELEPPDGFSPDDPASWPRIPGRLEYVGGKLLYMPPCADVQQQVTVSVVGVLDRWLDDHAGFVVGGNEAGMLFGRDVRGAEAAVWPRAVLGPRTGGYVRVPPLLAVEVAGREENEAALRAKAEWYLAHGVHVVWIVLPAVREVVVVTSTGERRYGSRDTIDAHPELPGLAPSVERFFRQL